MQTPADSEGGAAESRAAEKTKAPRAEASSDILPTATFVGLMGALRRQRRLVLLWTIGCLALAAALIFSLEPWYRAQAQVILDSRKIHYAEVRAVLAGPEPGSVSDLVRTEAAVLASRGLARRVVESLDLVDSPAFAPVPPLSSRVVGWGGSVLRWATDTIGLPLGGAAAYLEETADYLWVRAEGEDLINATVNTYLDRLDVSFDGRSRIIVATLVAQDREEAARILNSHVGFYIENQQRMKSDALSGASVWLDREIQTLAIRLANTERAVQEFRESNKLFSPGGTALVAQEMIDLSKQLTAVQGEVSQREAQLQRLRTNGVGAADTMSEVTGSLNIGRLRMDEIAALRHEADTASQFGRQHPTQLAARAQRAEIQRKIAEEVQKLTRSLEGEHAIARARKANLQAELAEMGNRMAVNERAEARARELEREANAVRALYESLLVRRQQVSAQEGTEQADARIVSEAVPPLSPAYPMKKLFLFVAAVASVSSGVGLALVRDRMRSTLGTADEVEEGLGLPVLGALPAVPPRAPLALQVVQNPKSVAAEAVRNLRHRLALSIPHTPPHILVVTSALSSEGKTSVALALARSMAGSGLAVLLVDADLRRPAVARAVWGRSATVGVIAVIEGKRSLDEAVQQDPASPLRILAAEGTAVAPQDVLASRKFNRLLATAAKSFDCIILDTPPAAAFSDAVLVGRAATGTIMVVRCNNTPVDAAQDAVRGLTTGGAGVLGAVLNGVNFGQADGGASSAQKRYDTLRSYACA